MWLVQPWPLCPDEAVPCAAPTQPRATPYCGDGGRLSNAVHFKFKFNTCSPWSCPSINNSASPVNKPHSLLSSTSSPSTHCHSARCCALLGAGGRTVGGIRIRLGTSDQLSVRGCSNIFDEAWRPVVGQAEAEPCYDRGHRKVGVPPLLWFDSHTMSIAIIRNTPYIFSDHGLFRHLGKTGANHGLFRSSGLDLHSPFWSMAID
ncbi:hypothetical protein B0T18DRAFT_205271 [Schizothecium vesticola]|uniref:Uncharacterized protein n=1 Tax=Schizothecium vesticola TaxID=314040 RepID=A0AA40EJ31_9PEZI|nr:hypothetical protein B0T18DRAFT_205271 [Schizothecium vesticola]